MSMSIRLRRSVKFLTVTHMAVEPLELVAQRPNLRLVEPTGVEQYSEASGYTLVPYQEDEHSLSLNSLIDIPAAYARGLGRAATSILSHQFGNHAERVWPVPEARIVPINGHNRSLLITEANPESGIKPDEATTDFWYPGLMEVELGSALLLHMAMARQFSHRRQVTLFTPGVTTNGHVLPLRAGYNRTLEETVSEDIVIMRGVANDAPANVGGTSFGSKRAILIAALNMVQPGESHMNIEAVRVISSAIGARDVPAADKFSEVDASDAEFVKRETNKFYWHTAKDIVSMSRRHPEKAGECMAVMGAYAMAPHKLAFRLAAIAGNLRSAQQGVDYQTIVDVAQAHPTLVLGGAEDSLMQAQLQQWLAVKKRAPDTQIRLLEKYGHTMTMAAQKVVEQLAIMELQIA